jgi:hypothetical protein
MSLKHAQLSDQAMGTLMMCLQKCLLEQSDITEILKNLKFVSGEGKLYISNPPVVKFNDENMDNTFGGGTEGDDVATTENS